MNPPQPQQSINNASTPLINVPPQESHGNNGKIIIVLVVFAVIGLFGGIGWYVLNTYQSKQANTLPTPTPQAAYTQKVIPTSIPTPTQTIDEKINAVAVSSDDADLKAVQTDISGL